MQTCAEFLQGLNKEQNEAGLAISIKHLKRRSEVFNLCLQLNKPFVDMGLAYVLKYLKDANAKKYFEILIIFFSNLKVALWVSTYRTDFWCFFTHYKMSTVSAFPHCFFCFFKYLLHLNIF